MSEPEVRISVRYRRPVTWRFWDDHWSLTLTASNDEEARGLARLLVSDEVRDFLTKLSNISADEFARGDEP